MRLGRGDTGRGSGEGRLNANATHARGERALEIRHTFHFLKRLRFPSCLQILEISRAPFNLPRDPRDSIRFYRAGKTCQRRFGSRRVAPRSISTSARPSTEHGRAKFRGQSSSRKLAPQLLCDRQTKEAVGKRCETISQISELTAFSQSYLLARHPSPKNQSPDRKMRAGGTRRQIQALC